MDESAEFLNYLEKLGYGKSLEIVRKAISFLGPKLEEKKMISGISWFSHNLRIGKVLADLGFGLNLIVCGVLYKAYEEFSVEELEKMFGVDIACMVYGVKDFKAVKRKGSLFDNFDALRKLLLVAVNDPRVLFVKFADKYCDLLNLNNVEKIQKEKIAREVLEIYSPLAQRFGLEKLRREMDNEAFKILDPENYYKIFNYLSRNKRKRLDYVGSFMNKIEKILRSKKLNFKIKGREKSLYSIFRKLKEKDFNFDKLFDTYAVRVIVKNKNDCYLVLGIIHEFFESLDGRIKDYILNPKPNGYQSIHTVVKFLDDLVEVQIRTYEMDEFAEEGKASHWSYKKMNSDYFFEKRVGWLRAVMEIGDVDNAFFIKCVKEGLFGETIFVYTPQGDLIDLPASSTVLDFAYKIHQEIGDKTIGALINGKFFSLKQKLNNLDVVEVVTNKFQRPRRDWLNFVVSARAYSKIKIGLKKYENIPVPKRFTFVRDFSEGGSSLVYSADFNNCDFYLAKCCNPLPDNELLGFSKSVKNTLVHRKDCEKIFNFRKNGFEVFWKDNFFVSFCLWIYATEKSGILAEILNIIIKKGFSVLETKAKNNSSGEIECFFKIAPKPRIEIVEMIAMIKKLKSVKRIRIGSSFD